LSGNRGRVLARSTGNGKGPGPINIERAERPGGSGPMKSELGGCRGVVLSWEGWEKGS